MNLIPLPAFRDNYLWMLHDGRRALVVDPGDAQPVLACLQRDGLQLEAILVTHHHPDHIGGVDALREATGAVAYGPARERIPESLIRLAGGDAVTVLGLHFDVLDVPGHAAGHIAYLRSGRAVEPHNAELIHYLRRCEERRAQDLPTLASTIDQEKRINPFLRMCQPGAAQAARAHDSATQQDDVAVFATLRQWKNEFK